MYYSEEQILTSLHIIKTVCSGFKAQDCKFCPFGNINGNCIIRFNTSPQANGSLMIILMQLGEHSLIPKQKNKRR